MMNTDAWYKWQDDLHHSGKQNHEDWVEERKSVWLKWEYSG